jgi:hypothetical protein
VPHPDIGVILSVRQSTRSCLTTFSLFTSLSPQHEADNDAKREGGSQRGDRAIRYDLVEMALLLAEIIQRCLDLIGESIGLRLCCTIQPEFYANPRRCY